MQILLYIGMAQFSWVKQLDCNSKSKKQSMQIFRAEVLMDNDIAQVPKTSNYNAQTGCACWPQQSCSHCTEFLNERWECTHPTMLATGSNAVVIAKTQTAAKGDCWSWLHHCQFYKPWNSWILEEAPMRGPRPETEQDLKAPAYLHQGSFLRSGIVLDPRGSSQSGTTARAPARTESPSML